METTTATTTSNDGEILPAAPVHDMVCDALIARDGTIHYAEAWAHDVTAMRLGYADVDAALSAGLVYVTISSSTRIEAWRHVTDAQEAALVEMHAVAAGGWTSRAQRFCKAYKAFASEQGWT